MTSQASLSLSYSQKSLTHNIESASAHPIMHNRERDACDVIDTTLKSQVTMHMIISTARRPYASTRSEPVECSKCCKDKELGA